MFDYWADPVVYLLLKSLGVREIGQFSERFNANNFLCPK